MTDVLQGQPGRPKANVRGTQCRPWGPWSGSAFVGLCTGSWSGTRGSRTCVQEGQEDLRWDRVVQYAKTVPRVSQCITMYFLCLHDHRHKFYFYSPIHFFISSLTNSRTLSRPNTATNGNNPDSLEQWKHLICHPKANPASLLGSPSPWTLHPLLGPFIPFVLSHPQISHCRALRL